MLTSHILKRLKPQAEESIAEQILNLRIVYGKHPQNLYHVFIDFKKAVDMGEYGIRPNLVMVIEPPSPWLVTMRRQQDVPHNGCRQTGLWTLPNTHWCTDDHGGTVRTGRRPTTTYMLPMIVTVSCVKNTNWSDWWNSLVKHLQHMGWRPVPRTLMSIDSNDINVETKANGQKAWNSVHTVQIKIPGCSYHRWDPKPEVLSSFVQTTAVQKRLKSHLEWQYLVEIPYQTDVSSRCLSSLTLVGHGVL